MTVEEGKAFALGRLKRRDLSRGLIVGLLVEKGLPEDEARSVVDQLVSLGYVDDERLRAAILGNMLQGAVSIHSIEEELHAKYLRPLSPEERHHYIQIESAYIRKAIFSQAVLNQAALRRAVAKLLRKGFSEEVVMEQAAALLEEWGLNRDE